MNPLGGCLKRLSGRFIVARPDRREADVTARTDDYDEIVRVVQLYIDAWNDNDISKLREAFDEDAWIFYIDARGICHKQLISKSFEAWAAPPSRGVVGRFISVTQVGDAAAVQHRWYRAPNASTSTSTIY